MKERIYDASTGETIEREFTDEELAVWNAESTAAAWTELRAERNRLLAACDWTVSTDSPVDVTAWSTYRQALRDLPANTTDPTDVVWPTPPS